MDSLNASDRLRTIVDFLLHFPTREQLVVFLSSGVCPFGEVVGVCTGYLDNDGNINFEFSHGFNDLSHQKLKVHISADDPTAETLRSMKTKVMNLHTVFKQYPKVIAPAGIADYGTGVGFPTTSRRIYILLSLMKSSALKIWRNTSSASARYSHFGKHYKRADLSKRSVSLSYLKPHLPNVRKEF